MTHHRYLYIVDLCFEVLREFNIPSLTITNDQLTLTTTDGHQRIDGFDTGLHGLAHGDTGNDTGGFHTDTLAVEDRTYINIFHRILEMSI